MDDTRKGTLGGREEAATVDIRLGSKNGPEAEFEGVELSSRGWHEVKHDPRPYINFLLYTLKSAYKDFEERVGSMAAPKGEKTTMILDAIHSAADPFRIADLQARCSNASLDLIRKVLKAQQKRGSVACLGRGQKAQWKKTKAWRRM